MGIGRRKFLALLGTALAGAMIDPLQAVATHDNVYVNKKLGILFHKPQDWGFIHVKDFGKLKDEQILGNDWDEWKDEIWEDLGDPICIITKYYQQDEAHKGIFSPTVTLHITPQEELDDLTTDFDELMNLSEQGTSMLLQDFAVVKRYEPYELSGVTFYEYDATYLFEHVELKKPLPVELKVLKTRHNGFYYDFNFHQSKAQGQVAQAEFEALKQSIRLI